MGLSPVNDRQIMRAVRLAKALLQLRHERDPTVRALLEPGAADDEAALGPPTHSRDQHRAEAHRLREYGEAQAQHDSEAAISALAEAVAHALWADDLDLAEQCLRSYQRLVSRRDMA